MSSSSEILQVPLDRPSGRAAYDLVLPWPLAGDQPQALEIFTRLLPARVR